MPIQTAKQKAEQAAPPLYEALRNNYRAFILYFHGRYMKEEDEVPDLHVIMFDRMVNSQEDAFVGAVPRDHAKTTVAKLVILWFLLYRDYSFPLYISDTHGVAAEAVSDIWDYLTSEEFIALTGEPVEGLGVERRADGFFQFKMLWYPAEAEKSRRYYKTVNLLARGAGQQVRGTNKKHQRPDLLVMDDMETEEVMGSKELFEKFTKWCYGTLFKALRTGKHKIIHIGNLISHQSLLQMHLDDEEWDSMRYGALVHDDEGKLVALWPERWSLKAIRKDHNRYARVGQLSTWYAEMMNLPFNPDSSLVDLGKVQYVPAPDPADARILAAFLTVDPAISDRATADNCAFVMNLLMDDGSFIHAETYKKRGMDFQAIYSKCVELSAKWHSNLVFIEDVAFQKVLLQVFKMQTVVDALEMNYVGVPTGNASKLARLTVWASMLHSGAIKIYSGDTDISGEIANFDRTKKDNKDDVMDAAAQVPIAMSMFANLIYASRVSGQQIFTFTQEREEGVSI